MSSVPRKLWKWFAGTLAVLVILLGLGIGVFRIALDQVPEYRTQIQDWVSARTGLAITFSELDARWRFYGPELVFENATVSTPDGGQTLVQARRGSVAFDIWASLATGRLTTGRFWFEAPELVLVRTAEGRIQLVGQDELPERTAPFSFDALPAGRFSVSDARVTLTDLATSRGPWTFENVDLTLQRGVNAMRLTGAAELPSALGRQLEFAARSSGALDAPQELDWNFALQGRDVDLAGLKDLLPPAWPAPSAGSGSFTLAGVLRGARVEELTGDIDLAGVVLPLPTWTRPLPVADPLVIRASADAPFTGAVTQPAPRVANTPQRIAYDAIRADFDMRRTGEVGWQLVVDGLQLVRPGARWDPSRIEINVSEPMDGALAVSGTAAFLSLDSLWPLLAYLPERDDTARLRALRATGRVTDLSFRMARMAADDVPPTYSVSGRLEAVGFAPVERAPGLGGVSGNFAADDQGGSFTLAAENFTFTLPRLFRESLVTDRVATTLTWRRGADRWHIGSDAVAIADADGEGTARFELALPDDGSSPWLDLEATGSDLNAAATPRYLPAGRLTARTLAWLDRAFPTGTVRTASIEYHGPVRSFPFRNDEGTFVARGDFANMTLDYDPRWMPLTRLDGDVEFHNEGLVAHASTGRVNGMQIATGRVGIADLRDAELDVQAQVNGDLGAALRYLQESSVGPALGQRFLDLEGRGATTIDANLWLPIKELESRHLDITARLANAELGVRDVPQRLTALNGPLQVLDRTLVSSGLQGRLLGGPVNITLYAQEQPDAPAATIVSASGRALAAPLTQLLHVPEVVNLTGGASWRLQARLVPPARGARREAGAAPLPLAQSYVIESDLAGLGIGLPAPLRKVPPEQRSLRAQIDIDGTRAMTLRGSLGELRTVARFDRAAEGWILDRAGVRVDGVAAAIPDHAGVRIEGDVPAFVLDDWLALRTRDATSGARLHDWLKAANVRVGTLGLLGFTWSDVRGLLQATPGGWQIDVNGPDAMGQLLVPYDLSGPAPISMMMERLALVSRAEGSSVRPTSADPRRLPVVQARINDLTLGVRKLGNVRVQLERVPQGLNFANVTAQGDSFSAEVKGSWLAHDGPDGAPSIATTIDGTLTSTDLRSTLQALGYGNIVSGERGLLQAKLNWPGGPDTQALARASGTVHVELEDGQVLDLQPGAGRVLGLLSVAALPRRLALDFSDLTDEGLAFDSVRGDFELKQGNAYTSNLLLSGPAAEIGIAGRTGLATRDYDQTAVVTGNIGATLPVAGALAGGPVVGAAMLLFSQMFKEPLKGITRGYYRITGNWDEPQVERVVASDAKEAAAAQAPAATIPSGPATSP